MYLKVEIATLQPNFTSEEIEVLLDVVEKRSKVLFGNFRTGLSSAMKDKTMRWSTSLTPVQHPDSWWHPGGVLQIEGENWNTEKMVEMKSENDENGNWVCVINTSAEE